MERSDEDNSASSSSEGKNERADTAAVHHVNASASAAAGEFDPTQAIATGGHNSGEIDGDVDEVHSMHSESEDDRNAIQPDVPVVPVVSLAIGDVAVGRSERESVDASLSFGSQEQGQSTRQQFFDPFLHAAAPEPQIVASSEPQQQMQVTGLTQYGGNYGGGLGGGQFANYSSEFEETSPIHFRNWAETIWDIYCTQKRMEAESVLHQSMVAAGSYGGRGSSGEDGYSIADKDGETSAKDTERESDTDRREPEFEPTETTGGADDVREQANQTLRLSVDSSELPLDADVTAQNDAAHNVSHDLAKSKKADTHKTSEGTNSAVADQLNDGDLEPVKAFSSDYAGDSATDAVRRDAGRLPSPPSEEEGSASDNAPAMSLESRRGDATPTEDVPEQSAAPLVSLASKVAIESSREEEKRLCHTCSAELALAANFCMVCGTKCSEPSSPSVSPKRSQLRQRLTSAALASKFEAWEKDQNARKVG